MAEGSVFDAILSGALPSHCVYQDEQVYAFLDLQPLARGHTLVIPRERAAQLHQLSDAAAAALGRALPRICRAVLAASGARDYNVLQNNGAAAHQAVFHVHFHVIPRQADQGLGIDWRPGRLDAADARALLERMHAELARG